MVHYGKTLETEKVRGWENRYVNYKRLKKELARYTRHAKARRVKADAKRRRRASSGAVPPPRPNPSPGNVRLLFC